MRTIGLRRAAAGIGLIAGTALVGVGPLVPTVVADNAATDCILPMNGAGEMGAIDFNTYVRPIGTVKALLLFVDFSDVPATTPADNLYEDTFAPETADYLATGSYGGLDLQITPVRHWLRMPKPLTGYTFDGGSASWDDSTYIIDALKAADPEVNYAAYKIVYIVPNKEETALTRASEHTLYPADGYALDGTLVTTIVTLGSDDYVDGWKTLAHETGHAFGLNDYYADTTGVDEFAAAGNWSIMSDAFDVTDNIGFDKWRLGWLTNDQVSCVNSETDDDYVLSPLGVDDGGAKIVVLRTGLQTAIVAEYRTATGDDVDACSEGVLIYRVNNGASSQPVRVADASPRTGTGAYGCDMELADAPFVDGDTFTDDASGIEIDVTSSDEDGATIHVSRSTTYVAPHRYGRSLTIKSVRNTNGTTTISGLLTASGHFAACQNSRLVTLQRLVGTVWTDVRAANTTSKAAWTYTFRAKPGVYRLLAADRLTSAYDCLPAFSKSVTVR